MTNDYKTLLAKEMLFLLRMCVCRLLLCESDEEFKRIAKISRIVIESMQTMISTKSFEKLPDGYVAEVKLLTEVLMDNVTKRKGVIK